MIPVGMRLLYQRAAVEPAGAAAEDQDFHDVNRLRLVLPSLGRSEQRNRFGQTVELARLRDGRQQHELAASGLLVAADILDDALRRG